MTICSLRIVSTVKQRLNSVVNIPVDKLVHHVFEYQYHDILYQDVLGEFQNAKVSQIILHTILVSFLG